MKHLKTFENFSEQEIIDYDMEYKVIFEETSPLELAEFSAQHGIEISTWSKLSTEEKGLFMEFVNNRY